jgi:hypothetical protein
LEPTAELPFDLGSPLEQHHVRAWHVDLDVAAAVHEALVAAENEPTQLPTAITTPQLAPTADARVHLVSEAAAARGVPSAVWGVTALAMIGGLVVLFLS